MKKTKSLIIIITMLSMLFVNAGAEGEQYHEIDLSGFCNSDITTFYTAAQSKSFVVCEAAEHKTFTITSEGTVSSESSIKMLEQDKDRRTYLSILSLTSYDDNIYAVAMTVKESESMMSFIGAGLYKIEESGEIGELKCALDLSDVIIEYGDTQDICACRSSYMDERYLYLLFNSEDAVFDNLESTRKLIRFDLISQEKKTIEMDGVFEIIASKEGNAVCVEISTDFKTTSLIQVDFLSQEKHIQSVMEGDFRYISAFLFDENNQQLFYAVSNQIWGVKQSGDSPKLLCLLPTRSIYGLFRNEGGKLIAFNNKSVFEICVDWSVEIAQKQFVVDGGNLWIDEYANLHPEIELKPIDAEDEADIITAVLTQSTVPDLFAINSDQLTYTVLKNRGYLVQLDDPEILEFIETLHPDIRQIVCINDVPCAIPVSINIQPILGINSRLWDTLNMGDVPTTWMDLIGFLEKWPDLYKDHPNLCLASAYDADSLRIGFMYQMMKDYENYRGETENAAYDCDIFRSLVSRLEALDWEGLAQEDTMDDRNTLIQFVYDVSVQSISDSFSAMPLSITEESDPYITVDLHLMAVNPYSNNIDIAKDCLKYVIHNFDPVALVEMSPDENNPIREVNYEDVCKRFLQEIDSYAQRISATTDEGERQYMQLEKDKLESQLANYIDSAWIVRPERIEEYRSVSKRMCMMNKNGLDDDTRTHIEVLRDRFLMREIGLNEFISETDRRLKMEEMEEE